MPPLWHMVRQAQEKHTQWKETTRKMIEASYQDVWKKYSIISKIVIKLKYNNYIRLLLW
jgi:hypothetical protein